MIDQIVKALGIINSFQVEDLSGSANPTQGAKLNLGGQLGALRLTAADGSDPGITIGSKGFGIRGLSLPTPLNRSLALDPYLEELHVDLDERFFVRAAAFAKDPTVAAMYQVINRVEMAGVESVVRLNQHKVLNADLNVARVALKHDQEELIRITDLSVSVLDFDTSKPPKVAQKQCVVVLRGMRVEIAQRFFERLLSAVRKKIPPVIEKLDIELPGPVMVVDGKARVKIPISFRADLRLETENDMFGIYFDRFYVPGTSVKLPGFTRNVLLGFIKTFAEDKLKGLVEISNESMRINPFSKIPVDLRKHVATFAVEKGKIVLEFTEPKGNDVPSRAEEHASRADRMLAAASDPVLAPGPAVGSNKS